MVALSFLAGEHSDTCGTYFVHSFIGAADHLLAISPVVMCAVFWTIGRNAFFLPPASYWLKVDFLMMHAGCTKILRINYEIKVCWLEA